MEVQPLPRSAAGEATAHATECTGALPAPRLDAESDAAAIRAATPAAVHTTGSAGADATCAVPASAGAGAQRGGVLCVGCARAQAADCAALFAFGGSS